MEPHRGKAPARAVRGPAPRSRRQFARKRPHPHPGPRADERAAEDRRGARAHGSSTVRPELDRFAGLDQQQPQEARSVEAHAHQSRPDPRVALRREDRENVRPRRHRRWVVPWPCPCPRCAGGTILTLPQRRRLEIDAAPSDKRDVGALRYSTTLPRVALELPAPDLGVDAPALQLLDGRVALRGISTVAACATSACSRANASSRFFSWLR